MATSQARVFTYARRFVAAPGVGKDPGLRGWVNGNVTSRDQIKVMKFLGIFLKSPFSLGPV